MGQTDCLSCNDSSSIKYRRILGSKKQNKWEVAWPHNIENMKGTTTQKLHQPHVTVFCSFCLNEV